MVEKTGKENEAADAFKSMTEMQQLSIRNFGTAGDLVCDCLRSSHTETMDFVQHQMKRMEEFPQKMMECKSPQDITQFCVNFVTDATKQNIQQSEALMKITHNLVLQMLATLGGKGH